MATAHPTPALAPSHATRGRLNGILFVALFALAVTQVAALPAIAGLGISPLIVGIVAGALYGNALRYGLPESWAAGSTSRRATCCAWPWRSLACG